MHERSGMRRNRDGSWSLVYGAGTGKEGQPLPNAPSFRSLADAKQHAAIRSIMAGRPTELLTPDLRELNFGAYWLQPKSNMPKGASLSPRGDLGSLRQREAGVAFKKSIKGPKKIIRAEDAF